MRCYVCFVTGGYITVSSTSMTYTSVIICESVIVNLLDMYLDTIDILASDIGYVYSNTYISERYTVNEFQNGTYT